MQGRCLCGAVAFEVRLAALRLYRCHCSLCRRQSGTASNCAAIVPAGAFAWLQGEAQIRSFRRPTGFRSDFCSACGAPVPNPLRATGAWWVPAGLLDAGGGDERPPAIEVVADFHLASRAAWDTMPAAPRAFAELPPLDEILQLLHPPPPG